MEPIEVSPLAAVLATAMDHAEGPLHRRLTGALRAAVLEGRAAAGRRLPPSRVLARALGISRNTVVAAYDQLTAEGLLTARVGAGSFVRADLPQAPRPAPQGRSQGGAPPDAGRPRPLPPPSRLAADLGALTPRGGPSRDAVPLRTALPPLDTFPWTDWARCLARPWRHPERSGPGRSGLGGSGPGSLAIATSPSGLPALQREIAAFLAETRAVACRPEQIFVVGGDQQALDLAARLLLDPGDGVLVEDPGFPGLDAVLRAAGAALHPVSVDTEGMILPAVPPAGLKALVVTPSRAFPLGTTMSPRRRLAVLDMAARAGAWVIEDDYDSDVRFDGRPEPALQGLEAASGVAPDARRVLYAGTFVRAMFPALRLGYLIVPAPLIDPATTVRLSMDGGESAVLQAAMAAFMAEGHLAAHLRAMRRLYAARRAALEDALRHHLGDCLTVHPADGGMHLAAFLPDGCDDRAIASAAAAQGLSVAPLSPHYRRPPGRPGLLLGFAGWPPEVLGRAVRRLAPVVRSGIGSGGHSGVGSGVRTTPTS